MSNGDSEDPAIFLGKALALVFDAIRVAERGRRCNPSVEEDRVLNERLNNLQSKRADVQAELDAVLEGTSQLPGPTAAQVAEISRLTGQVEALTSAALTASAAVAFSAKVLTVATNALAARPGMG